MEYHDEEWGYPVADPQRLFEKLCLESFQSGLSWRTILDKRPRFREVFHDFDAHRIARFDEDDVERLMHDAGIVRNRAKIEATIHNARQAIATDLPALVWGFEGDRTPRQQVRATSPESVALAKQLKQRGWKFLGPTTVYAFMQAMGLVNDHAPDCVVHGRVEAARARFQKP